MRHPFLVAFLLAAPSSALLAQGADSALYTRCTEMIPMRDGKRLYTVFFIPKASTAPLPFLMTRTPYGADNALPEGAIDRDRGTLGREGYIFVAQDIRGMYKSEGTVLMNRPPRAPGSTAHVFHWPRAAQVAGLRCASLGCEKVVRKTWIG